MKRPTSEFSKIKSPKVWISRHYSGSSAVFRAFLRAIQAQPNQSGASLSTLGQAQNPSIHAAREERVSSSQVEGTAGVKIGQISDRSISGASRGGELHSLGGRFLRKSFEPSAGPDLDALAPVACNCLFQAQDYDVITEEGKLFQNII